MLRKKTMNSTKEKHTIFQKFQNLQLLDNDEVIMV